MLFDYPLYYAINDVFKKGQNVSRLSDVLSQDEAYMDARRLSPILDNHDNDRFLSSDSPDEIKKLKLALGFILTVRGSPTIYYGTEIGLTGSSAGDRNREDMKWDDVSMNNPMISWVRTLLSIRETHPVLGTGEQFEIAKQDPVYAFLRTGDSEEAIIVINNGNDTNEQTIHLPGGHRFTGERILTDVLSPHRVWSLNGKIHLTIPPKSIRIYIQPVSGKSPLVEARLKKRKEKKLPTIFEIYAPDAGKVFAGGNFNDWKDDVNELKLDEDGVFRSTIELAPGEYDYKFIADGDWDMLNKENRVIKAGAGFASKWQTGNTILAVKDSNVEKVYVVGSFNNWNDKRTPMEKNAFGVWIARVDLPDGKNLIKFVGDDDWDVFSRHPVEVISGEDMSLRYMKKRLKKSVDKNRITFSINAPEAKTVDIASGFNDWQLLPLEKVGRGIFSLTRDVPDGIHMYQFLLDGGIPVLDPGNLNVYTDDEGNQFSVLEVGGAGKDSLETGSVRASAEREVLFNYENEFAQSVMIAGSFNGWKPGEYILQKNSKGMWTIKINLPVGKILYQFIVDGGVWVNDPFAESIVQGPGGGQVSARIVK